MTTDYEPPTTPSNRPDRAWGNAGCLWWVLGLIVLIFIIWWCGGAWGTNWWRHPAPNAPAPATHPAAAQPPENPPASQTAGPALITPSADSFQFALAGSIHKEQT